MAKIAVSLFTLLVLAAASSAAEIQNPGDRCVRARMESCRRYLREGSRFGGGWREAFPQCCEELEQLDHHCRCQALKQVVREQQQEGELQGQEMREMLQTAQSLPSLCRMEPSYCHNIEEISAMF